MRSEANQRCDVECRRWSESSSRSDGPASSNGRRMLSPSPSASARPVAARDSSQMTERPMRDRGENRALDGSDRRVAVSVGREQRQRVSRLSGAEA